MMASSTTSPTAMTSPAMTIVLMVAPPRRCSTERRRQQRQRNGVRLMRAVRQSKRKAIRIDDHQAAADRQSAWSDCRCARSMKVAGRKMRRIDLDVRQAGPQRLQRRLHVAGHLQRVAVGLLLDDQQQARAVIDDRIADRRRVSRRRPRATSPRRSGAPPRNCDHGARQVLRRPHVARRWRTGKPLVRRVHEAAGRRQRAASPAARDHAVQRDAVGARADPDRRAPGTAGRAGPRWPRWPRRAPPSAAAGSSTAPDPTGPSGKGSSTRRRSS